MVCLQKRAALFLLTFGVFFTSVGFSRAIEKDYCVSLQGNGRAIYAHFGALAYLVEAHGIPKGVAGGSSATVSMFILESILENPALQNAVTGQVDVNDPDTTAKVAFLLKSIVALGNYMDQSIPSVYFGHHFRLFANARKLVQAMKDGDLTSADLSKIKESIVSGIRPTDFGSVMFQLYKGQIGSTIQAELGPEQHKAWVDWLKNYGPSLFNEETIALLLDGIAAGGLDGRGTAWFLKDMQSALSEDKIFQFEDMRDFLRPFPISFEGIAQLFGSIGDFYAGVSFMHQSGAKDPSAAVQRFEKLFAACDATNMQRWVGETFSNGGANSSRCSAEFKQMLQDHFGDPQKPKVPGLEFNVPKNAQRRFAAVGTNPQLSVLPVVAMLSGKAATDLRALKQKYQSFATDGGPSTPSLTAKEFAFEAAPGDLKYGYFAAQDDRDTLAEYFEQERQLYKAGKPSEGGIKGRQSSVLRFSGDVAWNKVLSSSPAEPTIASYVEFGADEVEGGPYASLSGWGGLFDVFPLKAIGCKETVYVTTRQVRKDGYLGFEFPLQITKKILAGNKTINSNARYNTHIKEMYSLDHTNHFKSSHEKNLAAADMVLCTSWNSKKVWGMDYNRRYSSFRDAYLQSSLVGTLQATGSAEPSAEELESPLQKGIKHDLKISSRQIKGSLAPVGCRR